MLVTSYSSIQSFSECPRQWYLKDYRRLRPVIEKRTGALGFGGRIHTALEIAVSEKADLIEVWHALSAHEYALVEAAGGGAWDTSELDKETKLGLIMLEGYLEWEAAEGDDQEYEVIAVEKQMKNTLHIETPAGEPVDIWMYGKLDQVLRNRETGFFRIKDWKTTGKLMEETNGQLFQSPQPRIYRMLLEQEFPGLVIEGVVFSVLRKVQRTARATPPFYWNYPMPMSDYNVEAHMKRVLSVVTRMDTARKALDAGQPHEWVVPFNTSWRCKSCPFRGVCVLWQDTSLEAGEAMIEDAFMLGDPMERYDGGTEAEHEIS